MQKRIFLSVIFILLSLNVVVYKQVFFTPKPTVLSAYTQPSYWMLLHRKSNTEFLYYGVPGEVESSAVIKKFQVKTGAVGKRPTPLPSLLGREYWNIIAKVDASENLETAPYFLTLDVPVSEEEPFGPTPYLECKGQCNWELPGYFGLHGINGDAGRLSPENEGSSGCIRHTDKDITYLFHLFNPEEEKIRYYIKDV